MDENRKKWKDYDKRVDKTVRVELSESNGALLFKVKV